MQLDFTFYWTWFLAFTRMSGVLYSLPAIGTDQVPESMRIMPAILIGLCIALAGGHAELPPGMAQFGLMVTTEFLLGWILGAVPSLTLAGLSVAGQIVAGVIGLAQANMLDASLGESVSVISKLKTQIATLLFLSMGGHHIVLRAAANISSDIGFGLFRPDMDTFQILLERFTQSFTLAIIISAPIIVSSLLTQFVLGLVTKFVPQVNVFIISMPLTILAGLFIIVATFYGLAHHAELDFTQLEETLARIMTAKAS
ncbi:MAG: flagellar biosynthetic protein FliR [Bdellovibrionota bacterium]